MEFSRLLELVGDEPLFEAGLLLTGDVDPNDVRRQLSRWVKAGWVVQLRRGLYNSWERLVDDVRPFLERSEDLALLN
ncbi:MAG: hypothetical protein D6770_00340 [Anaerolineae bacterium]|nr:MAG: hypothetical protein D6770_00340 [Anaerolineae bacterium]